MIDGRDISPLLFENASVRDAELFYYFGDQLWALRRGPWKMHLNTTSPASVATWGNWPIEEHDPPLLFNVEHNPSEQHNVADEIGDISLIGRTPADKIPWGFTLSQDGEYLFETASQGATITAYKVGKKGSLEKVAAIPGDQGITDIVTREAT